MSETPLKNYLIYLKKIETYAKASGIRIYWRDSAEDLFNHRGSFVVIDSTLSETDEIATLLHEIGHGLDPSFILQTSQTLFDAYDASYSRKSNNVQDDMVYEAEVRAWNNGRVLAKLLKIPLGKWYSKVEEESLKTYKEKT